MRPPGRQPCHLQPSGTIPQPDHETPPTDSAVASATAEGAQLRLPRQLQHPQLLRCIVGVRGARAPSLRDADTARALELHERRNARGGTVGHPCVPVRDQGRLSATKLRRPKSWGQPLVLVLASDSPSRPRDDHRVLEVLPGQISSEHPKPQARRAGIVGSKSRPTKDHAVQDERRAATPSPPPSPGTGTRGCTARCCRASARARATAWAMARRCQTTAGLPGEGKEKRHQCWTVTRPVASVYKVCSNRSIPIQARLAIRNNKRNESHARAATVGLERCI